MLTASEMEDLRRGRFEIQCLDMRLQQNVDAHPHTYSGPGRIYQRADGQLLAVMYMPGVPEPPREEMPPTGEVIADRFYFHLWAVDFQGREWSSPRTLPDVGWSGPAQGLVIHLTLDVLEATEQALRTADTVSFAGWVLDDLQLPANATTTEHVDEGGKARERWAANVLSLDAAGTQVRIVQHAEYAVVHASTAQQPAFPPHFRERLRETLQFVTGLLVAWAVTVEHFGTEVRTYIRGRPHSAGRSRVPRPLLGRDPNEVDDIGKLFDLYLRYVLATSGRSVHPMSAELTEVLRSGLAPLEVQATISCIAVESICRHLLECGAPGIAEVKGEGERVRKWVAEWPPKIDRALASIGCPERLRSRIGGLLGMIHQTTAKDVLHKLSEAKALSPELLPVWERTRHPAAHGDREGQGPLEQLTRDCAGVIVLVYQLCLHAIGYRGAYTNYTAPGWSRAEYPPP